MKTLTRIVTLFLVATTAPISAYAASDPAQLTIKGSDTMVQLVSSWAEDFMKSNPSVDVSVTGGGSGTGIAALLNGTTDICAASRSMEPKEMTMASEKGIAPKETIVARDGIAVIVNPGNPVKELSLDQLKKIYTGEFKSWKDVGGPDEAITLLSRESSSGTYVFFQEHVLKKQDYAATAKLMPATASIVSTVANDKFAIGYVGLGYAEEAKNSIHMIGVKSDPTVAAVLPSEATVKAGTYPISRPLYLYTVKPNPMTSDKFLAFTLSPEGQKIVRETGYVTVQ